MRRVPISDPAGAVSRLTACAEREQLCVFGLAISVEAQPRGRRVEIEIGARLYASTRRRTQVPNQTRDFDFDFETGDDNELTPVMLLISPGPAG